MKFRFCGDADVPDWLLKEITTLSKMTAIKVRLLVAEIVAKLQIGEVDFEKVAKHTSGANFDNSDVKAIVAALHFIVNGAAKYDVGSETLETELQQLGLPKENSEAISKVYIKAKDQLRAALLSRVLTLNKLQDVEWRVDYVLSSSSLGDLNAPSVLLNLTVKSLEEPEPQQYPFEVSADKFRVLLHELKTARSLMEGL